MEQKGLGETETNTLKEGPINAQLQALKVPGCGFPIVKFLVLLRQEDNILCEISQSVNNVCGPNKLHLWATSVQKTASLQY